ncbi:MAG: chorismate synthase, partial [Clostridia bacterium]|nr:chorismate synthase [Clostridia bacterium]
MSSEFGKCLKVSVFGQSHGRAIGVTVDGLPAGEAIDIEELSRFLKRRQPGRNELSTARKEPDEPVFFSGVENGKTCGSPICAIIENMDTRSLDYAELSDTPRPSHADYSYQMKYGIQASSGGALPASSAMISITVRVSCCVWMRNAQVLPVILRPPRRQSGRSASAATHARATDRRQCRSGHVPPAPTIPGAPAVAPDSPL